jgi:hypothetical protein
VAQSESSAAARSPWLQNFYRATARYGGVAIAVWLGFQIATQGVSDHYIQTDPMRAVLWRADSSDALTALARQRLAARDPKGAARFAKKALQMSPLSAAALSTLGFADSQIGQKLEADELMTLTASISRREVLAEFWQFRRFVLARQYSSGLMHVDALLRLVDDPVRGSIFKAVAVASRDERAIDPLVATLRTDPPWRLGFVNFLCADPDRRSETTASRILSRLSRGQNPPRDDEVSAYLARLVQEKKYQETAAAFRALSNSAPARGEFLSDGTFVTGRGIPPFAWSMDEGVGWTAQIAVAPQKAGRQALRIQYDGYSQAPPLRQLLVLPEGEYRLTGQLFRETPESSRLLSWSVSCVDGGTPLAKAARGNASLGQWTNFRADFQVPAAGCPAQWLELNAEQGDVRTDSVVWYTNLSVRPKKPGSKRG